MKSLAFFNMKGGVGKTTAVVNFAYFAAREGNKTLLWDLDAQGSATYHFQITPTLKLRAKDLPKEKKRIERLIKATDYTNLDIIPANFKIRHLDVVLGDLKRGTRMLSQFLKRLNPLYDYFFFDCPASMSLLAQSVFRAADYLIMPVIPTTLSIQTFQQVQKYWSRHYRKKTQLIPFFSMVDQRKSLHRETMEQYKDEFCEAFIPTRSAIEQMGKHRAPLPAFDPKSKATQEYERLWEEIKQKTT